MSVQNTHTGAMPWLVQQKRGVRVVHECSPARQRLSEQVCGGSDLISPATPLHVLSCGCNCLAYSPPIGAPVVGSKVASSRGRLYSPAWAPILSTLSNKEAHLSDSLAQSMSVQTRITGPNINPSCTLPASKQSLAQKEYISRH